MTDKKVEFDPGYSKHISSFMYFNEQVKTMLKSFKVQNQKSFQYRKLLPQLLEVLKKEIGFYYGCLLWAAYISHENPPKEIADNSFYGKTKDELEQYDYLQEVNYILNFFVQYPKDLNFYKIQSEPIDEKCVKTVDFYKEFLIINESFINTKMTSDIKLPNSINSIKTEDLIHIRTLIDKTVNDGDFERLYEYKLF